MAGQVMAGPQIRGVLLDKDGTLIDCDATWAPVIHDIFRELSPPGDPADLIEAAGLDPRTGRLRPGSVWAAGATTELVTLWWPDADGDRVLELAGEIDAIAARLGPINAVPLLDLDRFLAELETRHLIFGIATNDSLGSLRAFLDRHELINRVPYLYGYDSVVNPKPAPDMTLAFCEAAGLAAEEVAVVGDNVHDLEMARAAGAGAAIGVLTGNSDREHLDPFADAVIDGVADLLSWLDRQRAGEWGPGERAS